MWRSNIKKLAVCIIILLPAVLFAAPEPPYSIDELTESALAGNRELLQLQVEEEMTRIDLDSARAMRFPDIGGEITFSHIANPLDPISVTAGEFGTVDVAGVGEVLIPPQDEVLYEGMDPMFYLFTVTVEQPVFTWGKIRNSIDLYSRVLQTRRLNLQKKRKELKTAVTIYVYSLFYLEKIEELIGKQKDATDRLLFISEQSYENGFILYGELLEARIKAQEIRLGEYQLKEQQEQALLDLSHATMLDGLEANSIDFSVVDEELNRYAVVPKEELLEEAMGNNMDLKLLESMKNVADYKMRIARGKNYLKPDIGVRFELSYGGPRFPFIETGWYGVDDYNLISTLAFTTKLFDGGKLKAEIALSREELRASRYEYEKGRQSIEKFIAESLLKMELHKNNIDYYNLRIENSREQTALRKTQYEAGAGQESDYLLGQITEHADMIKLYQETIMFFTAYFTLMNVVYGE